MKSQKTLINILKALTTFKLSKNKTTISSNKILKLSESETSGMYIYLPDLGAYGIKIGEFPIEDLTIYYYICLASLDDPDPYEFVFTKKATKSGNYTWEWDDGETSYIENVRIKAVNSIPTEFESEILSRTAA